MTDHPEFPQESAAVQYIVDQVAKIESAHACSTGYYKTLGDVNRRLDKTDIALVQLRQVLDSLTKTTDAQIIRNAIWDKCNDIEHAMEEGLSDISDKNERMISRILETVETHEDETLRGFSKLALETSSTNKYLTEQISATNEDLRKAISSISSCLVIPVWQAWLFALGIFVAGILIRWFL